jgi:transcriptional regulator with XRE-family HTH domain
MKSASINVKDLREKLGLNQAELASSLCVTQATVARWESEKSIPSGDAARRLKQLKALLELPAELERLRKILASEGGLNAVAALLSLGSSVGGMIGITAVGALFGPLGLAGGAAAGLLFNLLKEAQETTKEKKTK